MNSLAPIILFTYKRLDTLKLTVNALQLNFLAKESELIIYSDGPKTEKDYQDVVMVRSYLKTIQGFKSINIIESSINKGLASSIIEGVTQVINQYGKAIVLEDDLFCTPNFLNFMNESLTHYKNNSEIFSISGYSFNLNLGKKYEFDTYFLNRGWSWGWATWSNRWENIDWDIRDYNSFKINKKAQKEFSKGGSDLNSMLRKQMNGNLDSWAIRWFYNQYKTQGLTIYPKESMVLNNGFDIQATHTIGSSKRYIPTMDNGLKLNFKFPVYISETKVAQKLFQQKMGYLSRIKSKIETILGL